MGCDEVADGGGRREKTHQCGGLDVHLVRVVRCGVVVRLLRRGGQLDDVFEVRDQRGGELCDAFCDFAGIWSAKGRFGANPREGGLTV